LVIVPIISSVKSRAAMKRSHGQAVISDGYVRVRGTQLEGTQAEVGHDGVQQIILSIKSFITYSKVKLFQPFCRPDHAKHGVHVSSTVFCQKLESFQPPALTDGVKNHLENDVALNIGSPSPNESIA